MSDAPSDLAKALMGGSSERRSFTTREEFDAYRDSLYDFATYRFGDWWINGVTRDSSAGRLPERSFEVLWELVKACPSPVSTQELARRVGEAHGHPIEAADLKVYIRRLRKQIGAGYIVTIPQVGYLFDPFPEVA